MKRGFILLTVLALAATLLAGCALDEETTPGSTAQPPIPGPSTGTIEETTPGPTAQPSIPGPSTGTIKVLVTDAPGDVSEVNVTVSEVEVHKAGGDGESGQWITLDIANEGEPFNLLALQDGLTLLLAGGQVEAGKYTQLRMTVFNVIVKTDDGPENEYQAIVPSGKLKFVRPFTLEAGETITLIVDFDAAKSVVFTGATKDGEVKVLFKPVVKLSIEHEENPSAPTANFEPDTGPPVGIVIDVYGTGWVASENITSVEVGTVAATTHTLTVVDGNLSGTITVPGGLAPGPYSIVIEGETSGEQTFADAFEVEVTA